MKIGYVCTNYNNSDYTLEAVRSLVNIAGHEFRVVVVDNKSSSESVTILKQIASRYPCVTLVLNDENLGYFPGLNVGLRWLREHYPDYCDCVAIGNNDLLFPGDFGDALARSLSLLAKHPVISPDVVTIDGVHQNPHVIAQISKFREVMYDLYFSNYYLAKLILSVAKHTRSFTDRSDEAAWQVARPIYQGHGSCYILGARFFSEFKELWAPTFLMGEEFFLSKQLCDKGMQVYYEPSIKVGHHCHAAIARVPARKMWEIARQAHRIYRRHVRYFG